MDYLLCYQPGVHPTIVTTPPADHHVPTHHPRRQPAHKSVSLIHSRDARLSPRMRTALPLPPDKRARTSFDQPPADPPSKLQTSGGNGGIAGSSDESSSPEKWFENSNNQVREKATTFGDDEPPYFLRNSSSSETPPDVQQQTDAYSHAAADAGNSLALPLLTNGGSSSDDYRGVIDDLTIANKKLKKRLRKYERLHDSHLKKEKLFEVRFHSLPPDKRAELEATLRKFAATVHPTQQFELTATGPQAAVGSGSGPSASSTDHVTALTKHSSGKHIPSPASGQTSDSAYVSQSTSGAGQAARMVKGATSPMSTANRHQNVHSYLSNMPPGRARQYDEQNMSERTKKKLVVRRLEQIFAGKGATSGGHQHPLQQQEVSRLAAQAGKSTQEIHEQTLRAEGTREAPVIGSEMDDCTAPLQKEALQSDSDINTMGASEDVPRLVNKNPIVLEQRETRPLDLDVNRAQVPADNMRYMRHLGFSPPDFESEKSPEEGHGWIYLNLLINMAQLHTISVTPEFVRKAVSSFSKKLELSDDGRKVRWKGSPKISRTSSAGDSPNEQSVRGALSDESPRKRMKLSQANNESNNSKRQTDRNKFIYTPMFVHKGSTDGDSSLNTSDSESSADERPLAPMPDSTKTSNIGYGGMIGSLSKKKKQKHDDGPIIFYNNARFCTDLSADHSLGGKSKNPPAYISATLLPVGQVRNKDRPMEKRGPLDTASQLPEPMDLSDNPIPESLELQFPQNVSTNTSSNSDKDCGDVPLEVSGIAGVWPSDHFAIHVEARQARVEHAVQPSASRRALPKRAHKLSHILGGVTSPVKPAIHHQVVSTSRKDLDPSSLPPPLQYNGSTTGSNSYDDQYSEVEDADDDDDINPHSPNHTFATIIPQVMQTTYAVSDDDQDEGDEYDDDDDDEDDDDGEVDFLTTAREMNPEAIRAKEIEYDAEVADRLAQNIPTGSSAATAGGGSGRPSPATRDRVLTTMNRTRAEETRQGPVAQPAVAVEIQSAGSSVDVEMSDASS